VPTLTLSISTKNLIASLSI